MPVASALVCRYLVRSLGSWAVRDRVESFFTLRPSIFSKFVGPSGIAVSAEGEVFVCDRYNHRVQAFSSTGGELLRVLGSGERSEAPGSCCACAGGRLYVSEWHGHRIQVLTPRGEPLQVVKVPRAECYGGLFFLPAPPPRPSVSADPPGRP